MLGFVWKKRMSEFAEALKTLTPQQLDFVAARLNAKSDKEAAESVGVSPDVAYSWRNKEQVNLAVKLGKVDGVLLAREKLRRLVYAAACVLEDEMGDDKKRRLEAAREVLDRTGIEKLKKIALTDPTGQEEFKGFTDSERAARVAALLQIGQEHGD